MLVKSKYLVFPVNKNGTQKRVDFLVDGKRVLYMNIRLDNINPDFENAILKALILGYMKQGGIQMQITCISREMLEEAYKNPEQHKNLVVRVGGYSEYFYKLNDELKRMVIERTIQKEV